MNIKKINTLFLASAPIVLNIMIVLFKKNISFEYVSGVIDLDTKEILKFTLEDKLMEIEFLNGKITSELNDDLIKLLKK